MEHLEACEGLIKRISDVESMLGEMYEEWWRVEENGRVVKEGCERVVEERVSRSALEPVCISERQSNRTDCWKSWKILAKIWSISRN
jgi:hypothetical protein